MDDKPDATFVNTHAKAFGGNQNIELTFLEIDLIRLDYIFPIWHLECVNTVKLVIAIEAFLSTSDSPWRNGYLITSDFFQNF